MHCCRLLLLKHREEGDINKLLLPSLLQQHHARKQQKKKKEGESLPKFLICPLTFDSCFKRVILAAHFCPPASGS
jgi:hypothetical protein